MTNEEAISTMISVRTVTNKCNDSQRNRDRHCMILHNDVVFSETSPTDEGDNGEDVCFTADEVQSFFDNAMN